MSTEYEKLVREQLEQLGYNSEAIPDTVLREFLADFEHMELSEEADGGPAAPLSYPTALSSNEAAGAHALNSTRVSTRARIVNEATAKSPPLRGGTRPRAARKADAGASPRPRTAPPSSGVTKINDDDVIASPPLAGERAYGDAFDEPIGDMGSADASSAEPAPSASFGGSLPLSGDVPDKHGRSALRSSSALSPRNASARPGSARPLASPSMLAGGAAGVDRGFSGSGVIIATASAAGRYGATPRACKSDPVSMHARRKEQWRSDSFLSHSRAKHKMASPVPVATVAASRRRVNNYVVPTAKRRDEVVWQTRLRMRHSDVDAGGKPSRFRSKSLVPNMYIPATDKRRDDLRWAVRSEMAWMH